MVCIYTPMETTKQQQALLDYLEKHQDTHGIMPSQREIQKYFGFASRNAVPKHLSALEKKGLLSRANHLARSLRLPKKITPKNFLSIPLLGSIPAGYAETQEEEHEHTLTIDLEMLQLPHKARLFALEVRGDSMINAGILNGDRVILEQSEAYHGDIVAALIDGESTLKRLIIEHGKSFLKAENHNYPDILPLEELSIQGVFRALFRVHKK
ncbi:MAG TPA: transcriptional repressor LexA [Chthoniobacterales bacterium]|nr:transcriptional repressor LexA [Chthoniobacterales bacterium]